MGALSAPFPSRGLFIAGAGTDVGKTYIAAMIARSLRDEGRCVGVYKPAASGCRCKSHPAEGDDDVVLWTAAGKPGDLSKVCPQRFEAPLAPFLAAKEEGREVDTHLLRSGLTWWTDHCDVVIVEGAGGLMSPVSEDDYAADLAKEFGYPVIIVVPNVIGVINQTLQTLITAEALLHDGQVVGVVLNDIARQTDRSAESNFAQLEKRCKTPILAHVRNGDKKFAPTLDWWRHVSSTCFSV